MKEYQLTQTKLFFSSSSRETLYHPLMSPLMSVQNTDFSDAVGEISNSGLCRNWAGSDSPDSPVKVTDGLKGEARG